MTQETESGVGAQNEVHSSSVPVLRDEASSLGVGRTPVLWRSSRTGLGLPLKFRHGTTAGSVTLETTLQRHGATVTDWVLEEQSAVAVADEDRHTLTLIVSLTVPGFIEIVTVVEVMAGVRDDVVQTPEPEPTPHLNCTTLPDVKPLPLMVRVCKDPLATIAVGLTLLTVGTAAAAGVTVTDCVLDEQSAVAVADDDRQTRTLIVSLTVPGFMGIVI